MNEFIENVLLARTAMKRLAENDKVWLTPDEAFGQDRNDDNPYKKMTDEELFD